MTEHIQLGHEPQLGGQTHAAEHEPFTAQEQRVSEDPLFEESPGNATEPVLEESVGDPLFPSPSEPVFNATLSDSIEVQSDKPLSKTSYKVSLPSYSLGVFTSLLTQAKAADQTALEAQTRKHWQQVSEEMTAFYTPGNLYHNRFVEEGSDFRQGLLTPEGELQQFTAPKFAKHDGELKGERALLKVSRALGQGDVLTIPLPHSGIHVTIKPPGERAIINFYNSVFREKISIGRMTAGLTLTNFSVYINNRLFEFILDHVHAVNYCDIDKADLRKYIKLPDFHILAAGLAASMYPNGFEYQRPCISADAKCDYIAQGLLNLSKVYWVDNSALTEVQKQILHETRPGKLTLDHYNKYQLEHTRMVPSSFSVNTGDSVFKFHLRTPSFEEHVSDGMAWVNQINGSVDAVITIDGDDAEARAQMLQQYVKSSTLRQFSHFIDYIEVDGSPMTDRDTLNKVLEVLSADDIVREKVFREVLKYKSNTVISVIGIPSYKCPSCHQDQNTTPVNQGLVDVIPLDVMNLFFTLLTLRMSRILER